MDSLTSNYDVIMMLLIGGILGVLGQGIRVWFGLSELNYNKSFLTVDEIANPNRRSGSIFIGFITGILIILLKSAAIHTITAEPFLLAILSGYIVTDFIESVLINR